MSKRELEALKRTVGSTKKLIERPPINAGLAEELENAEADIERSAERER